MKNLGKQGPGWPSKQPGQKSGGGREVAPTRPGKTPPPAPRPKGK